MKSRRVIYKTTSSKHSTYIYISRFFVGTIFSSQENTEHHEKSIYFTIPFNQHIFLKVFVDIHLSTVGMGLPRKPTKAGRHLGVSFEQYQRPSLWSNLEAGPSILGCPFLIGWLVGWLVGWLMMRCFLIFWKLGWGVVFVSNFFYVETWMVWFKKEKVGVIGRLGFWKANPVFPLFCLSTFPPPRFLGTTSMPPQMLREATEVQRSEMWGWQ